MQGKLDGYGLWGNRKKSFNVYWEVRKNQKKGRHDLLQSCRPFVEKDVTFSCLALIVPYWKFRNAECCATVRD